MEAVGATFAVMENAGARLRLQAELDLEKFQPSSNDLQGVVTRGRIDMDVENWTIRSPSRCACRHFPQLFMDGLTGEETCGEHLDALTIGS